MEGVFLSNERNNLSLDKSFLSLITTLGKISGHALDVRRYFHRIERKSRRPIKQLIRIHSQRFVQQFGNRDEIKNWLGEFVLFLAWFRKSSGSELSDGERELLMRAQLPIIPLQKVLRELTWRFYPSGKSIDEIFVKIMEDPLIRPVIPFLVTSEWPQEEMFSRRGRKTIMGLMSPHVRSVLRQLVPLLTTQMVVRSIPLEDARRKERYCRVLSRIDWKSLRQLKTISLEWDQIEGLFRQRVHEKDKEQVQAWLDRWFIFDVVRTTVNHREKYVYYPSSELIRLYQRLNLLLVQPIGNGDVFLQLKLSDDDFLNLHHAAMAARLHNVSSFAKRWSFRLIGWLFFQATLHHYVTSIRERGNTLDEKIAELEFYGVKPDEEDPLIVNAAENPYYSLFQEELIMVPLCSALVEAAAGARRTRVRAADSEQSRREVYYQYTDLMDSIVLEITRNGEMKKIFEKVSEK